MPECHWGLEMRGKYLPDCIWDKCHSYVVAEIDRFIRW